MTDHDSRRPGLIAAALAGIARDDGARPGSTADPIPGGAVLTSGGHLWAWLEDRPEHALGAVIARAVRGAADGVTIVVPESCHDEAGTVARRASQWGIPIAVFLLAGRERRAVPASVAGPEPAPAEDVEALVPSLVAAGADPVFEHGVLTGEVAGLEVCRVVDTDSGPRLEVGVGAHDREAFGMLHGDVPALDSLARIVEVVRSHRRPGADPHPLNRLAPERYLRHRLLTDPTASVATDARAVAGALRRRNLSEPAPAHLIGTVDGAPALIACTTGVDLGALVDAVDTRHWLGHRVDRLVVVVPARNRLPVLDAMGAVAGVPTEIRTVDDVG
ncbi:MAG: hypothetical protein RIR49_1629 [Actinomycetota bacterium]